MLDYPLYLVFGRHKTKVKAEYTGLKNTQTAVVIMAGPDVQFEHPHAQTNLAIWIAHAISQNVKPIRFIDQEKVDTLMKENIDWFELPIEDIAKLLEVDRILYLDLIRYTMEEEHSVNLLRGNIIADVRVYDIGKDPEKPSYQTEIQVTFPEHSPLPLSDRTMQKVQRQTMAIFADKLAKKFYNHKVTNE